MILPDEARMSWAKIAALVLALFALMSVGIGFWLYRDTFGHHLSNMSSEWGNFGSYAAGIFAFSFGSASLAAVLYASVMVPEQLERNRRIAEVSNLFYSQDYYLGVIVPIWEVATKWLSWDDPEKGLVYRRDVAGGQFCFKQVGFVDQQAADRLPFQNPINLRGHFMRFPIGEFPKSPNEHMLLSIWVRFWIDLEASIHAGLVRSRDARTSLARFYESYVPFMRELWMVGKALSKGSGEDLENQHWFLLAALEQRFYGSLILTEDEVDRVYNVAHSLNRNLNSNDVRDKLLRPEGERVKPTITLLPERLQEPDPSALTELSQPFKVA